MRLVFSSFVDISRSAKDELESYLYIIIIIIIIFVRNRPLGLFRFRIYLLKLMNLLDNLHTGQHNTEKRGHTSMFRMGFEPTIPVFERPKTVHASDRSTTGTGSI
jgi:hypothetical protein